MNRLAEAVAGMLESSAMDPAPVLRVAPLAVAALAVGLGAGSSVVSAQDLETEAVSVGERAPDFLLEDAHGASYRLSALVQEGPVVLEFFRSGGW